VRVVDCSGVFDPSGVFCAAASGEKSSASAVRLWVMRVGFPLGQDELLRRNVLARAWADQPVFVVVGETAVGPIARANAGLPAIEAALSSLIQGSAAETLAGWEWWLYPSIRGDQILITAGCSVSDSKEVQRDPEFRVTGVVERGWERGASLRAGVTL
jgi:hypothetical protein